MGVVGLALLQSNGAPGIGDLYLVAALVVCAAGYAEGGRLSSRIPGWQLIGVCFWPLPRTWS